jgi:hypothetical protein
LERIVDQLRSLAVIAVGRVAFLGWMPIAALVLAFSSDPPFALKLGGIGALVLCLALVERSRYVQRIDPRRHDLWSELLGLLAPTRTARNESPFDGLTAILRETHLRFARWVAGAAAAFFGGSVVSSALAS